ncbi:hypothetical protein NP493_35g05029 [Ridgeia piscesae]|uniref:Uncharacterized protein n=1 Tax=Ridgeia piscesae TaxID=27915 RepID=A0AAD9PCH3_RIDPI|nr:hypothetical protein NP493_35g05029 [Ridgeia piscesae]
MKKKVNFFDRPPSVSSGTPLGKRVVVQHRCDILLEEQVDKVRDIQDCLQRELVALDLSRTLTEISEHQEKVEELKNQLDEMLLLLKVAGKMTAEMKHSRVELRRHLKQGVDVTVLRKRVSWLERRIEKVLRMQSQQSCKLDDKVQFVTSSPEDTADDRTQEVGQGDMEEVPSATEQDIAPVSTDHATEEQDTAEQATLVQDRTTAKTDSETPMSPTGKTPDIKPELDEEKSEGPMEVDLTRYRADTPYPQGESEESSPTAGKTSRRLPSGDRVTLSEGISSSDSSSSSSSSSEEEEYDEPEKEEDDWDEEEEGQEDTRLS